jgi:chaperonin GroES
MPHLRPMNNHVLVSLLPQEERIGSLFIPQTVDPQKQIRKGTVRATHAGKLLANGSRLPSALSEGDQVLFEPYASVEVEFGGQRLHMLDENDVLGVVE